MPFAALSLTYLLSSSNQLGCPINDFKIDTFRSLLNEEFCQFFSVIFKCLMCTKMKFLMPIVLLGIFVGSSVGQSNFASLQSRVTIIARNFESEVERIHQDVSGFTLRSINDVLGQAYDTEMAAQDEVMVSACNLNVVNILRGDMRAIDDAIVGLSVEIAAFKTIIFRAVEGKAILLAPEGVREEINGNIDGAQNELQEKIVGVIRKIATFKGDTYNLIKTHRKCIANSV